MQHVNHDMEPSEAVEFISSRFPSILEIGCNDGTDTNKFLELLPKAILCCFEPDPRAIARFKETVCSDRVTLVECALSNVDGFATFFGSSGQPPEKSKGPKASHYCFLDEWDLSGSLCKPTGHLNYSPWVTFPTDRQYTVETVRLDTWIGPPDGVKIDFIWADVQGAEALLIQGGLETLARTKFFYTEFSDKEMYTGQPDLEGILKLLPTFEVVALYGRTNVLLRQTQLKGDN